MVNSVGSSSQTSIIEQLLGANKQSKATSVIPEIKIPTDTSSSATGSGSNKLQLSQTVLDLLQGEDSTGISSLLNPDQTSSDNSMLGELIGASKKASKNPYTDMLSATAMSSLYQTAFNGTLQKNQQDILQALGTKGIVA